MSRTSALLRALSVAAQCRLLVPSQKSRRFLSCERIGALLVELPPHRRYLAAEPKTGEAGSNIVSAYYGPGPELEPFSFVLLHKKRAPAAKPGQVMVPAIVRARREKGAAADDFQTLSDSRVAGAVLPIRKLRKLRTAHL